MLPPKHNFINPNYRPAYQADLGSIILRTDGTGIYMADEKVSFAARMIVELADHSEMAIPLAADGTVEAIHGCFELHFNKPFEDGHPFCDGGVTDALNAFLKTLGVEGEVRWSGLGKQSPYHGHLEADTSVFAHFFPEAVEARYRAHFENQ